MIWRNTLSLALTVAALTVAALTWPRPAAPQGAAAEILDVAITRPPAGEPMFGEVEVEADVYPPGSVTRVEFLVDGQLVGEADVAPFRVTTDVGQDNVEHRFEVRAYSPSGKMVDALLVSPSIQVDGEVVAELQQLYVTVTSSGGSQRILDLEAGDFAIIDNRDQQELVTFARGDVRLTAVILIDSSASMRGERLRYALRGATAFVSGIRDIDDASLVLFSDRLLHTTPFRTISRP